MKDIHNCGVDDLLRTVSPELIKRYDRVHGLSIVNVQEVYRGCEEICKISNIFGKYPLNIMFVFCALIIAATIVCTTTESNLVSISSILIAVILFLVFLFHLASKESIEALNIKEKCSFVITNFRNSVEGLFPRGSSTLDVNGAYQELIYCAVVILDAEEAFDTFRLAKGRAIEQILLTGLHLKSSRKIFDRALECSGEFGFEYDRRQLFAEARRIISSRTTRM